MEISLTGRGLLRETRAHPPPIPPPYPHSHFYFNIEEPLALHLWYFQAWEIQGTWLIRTGIVKIHPHLARKWNIHAKCESGIWFWCGLILQQHLCLPGKMSFLLLNLNRNYQNVSAHCLFGRQLSYLAERKDGISTFILSNSHIGHTLLNTKMNDYLMRCTIQWCFLFSLTENLQATTLTHVLWYFALLPFNNIFF